jgi:hypothetical protein
MVVIAGVAIVLVAAIVPYVLIGGHIGVLWEPATMPRSSARQSAPSLLTPTSKHSKARFPASSARSSVRSISEQRVRLYLFIEYLPTSSETVVAVE